MNSWFGGEAAVSRGPLEELEIGMTTDMACGSVVAGAGSTTVRRSSELRNGADNEEGLRACRFT